MPFTGIEVISCVSHTLYNTRDVVAKNGGKAPLTYKGFEKAIAALGPPEPPAEDPPAKLPPIGADSKGTDSEKTGVPCVRELGYPDEASTDIKVRITTTKHWCLFCSYPQMHNAMKFHWLLFQQWLLFWTCLINLSRICWSASHHSHPPMNFFCHFLGRTSVYRPPNGLALMIAASPREGRQRHWRGWQSSCLTRRGWPPLRSQRETPPPS